MLSKIWHFCTALLCKRRTALLTSALAVGFLMTASAQCFGTATPVPALGFMPLEEMERGGKVILAYAHDSAQELETQLAMDEARCFTVRIKADGVVTEHSVVSGDSVEEVLEKAGIVLGEEDQLSHMPYRPIERGDFIVVERWSHDVHTVEEKIPFKTEEIYTSLLSPGVKKVIVKGNHGLKATTYKRVLKDGVVQEKTIQSEEIISKPSTQKEYVGAEEVPVSTLDFEWELDENGLPETYEAVLEDQRAAGYSANPGAKTASGRKAAIGHVAVNPNVIPYGTKLYIRDSENNFVYGYAIAADTGIALMQGVIDVDLFYGTYVESVLNGIRNVDIYILEYPQQNN